MAKSITLVALIASAFCFSFVVGNKEEHFFVEGKIYCDPCRLEFQTKLSYALAGVKVSVECKKPEDGSLTYSNEGFTDGNGVYSIPVEGDHEDEICELKTVMSDHPECNEIMSTKASDKVVLTTNMGVSSMARYVNPLGFMTKTVDPKCAEVIKELDLNNDGDD